MKDNHRKAFKNIAALRNRLLKIKSKSKIPIEVEADDLQEFGEILKINPDIILLDNFSVPQLKKAVTMLKINKKGNFRPLLEASGGITLKNIRAVAQTGVDRVSIGALTHTHRGIDVSLEIMK